MQVNLLVSRAETRKGCKQVSVFSNALTSDFYFFPGLSLDPSNNVSSSD